jgi:predicted MFS family arabinose efflux permease
VSTQTVKAADSQEEPVGSLWHHHDFLRLWAGQSLSLIGAQITLVAIPLIAVTLLAATPFEMGILGAASRLPFIFVLFVGVWVDRLRRRPLLIGSDLGRAALLAMIPLLFFTGELQLIWLALVVLCVGVLQVVFDVADLAYLPSLVEPARLPEANSKIQVSQSVADVAGPGLVALLMGWISAAAVIVIDSISLFCSAIAVASIRRREPPPAKPQGDRPGTIASIKEGVRFVWAQPLLRPILVATAFLMFCWPGIMALYYPFAYRDLGIPARVIAMIMMIGGPAAIAGAVLAPRLVRRWGMGRMLIVSGVFGNGSFLLIPFATRPTGLAVAILATAQFLFAIGMPLGIIVTMTIRQTLTPQHLQGRVAATFRAVGLGVSPFGALAAGALSIPLGVRATIAIFMVGCLVPIAVVFLSPLRRVRTVADIEVPAGARV